MSSTEEQMSRRKTLPIMVSEHSCGATSGSSMLLGQPQQRRTQSFRPPPLNTSTNHVMEVPHLDQQVSTSTAALQAPLLMMEASVRRKKTSLNQEISADKLQFSLYQVPESQQQVTSGHHQASSSGSPASPCSYDTAGHQLLSPTVSSASPSPRQLSPWQLKCHPQRDYETHTLTLNILKCQPATAGSGTPSRLPSDSGASSTGLVSPQHSRNNSTTLSSSLPVRSGVVERLHLSPFHRTGFCSTSSTSATSTTLSPFFSKEGMYLRVYLSTPLKLETAVRTTTAKCRSGLFVIGRGGGVHNCVEWNEKLVFPLPGNVPAEDVTLRMVLWGLEKPEGTHVALGERRLSLDELERLTGAREGVPLCISFEVFSDLGSVSISLSHLSTAGRFTLDILEAKNLRPCGFDSYPDMFVKATFMDCKKGKLKSKRTHVIKQTLDPVFNESIRLEVKEADQLSRLSVVITVCARHFTTRDVCLGRVILGRPGVGSGNTETTQWDALLRLGRNSWPCWHALKSKEMCRSLASSPSSTNKRTGE